MKRTRRKIGWIVAAAVLGAFITVGAFGPLEITRYDVSCSLLPAAFDGYKILQIADLQNSTDPGILADAQQLAPDVIVFSGDNFYTSVSPETEEWTINLVHELAKIAPVYAVSGNHDLWNPDFKKNQSLLAGAGVILLENTFQTVQRGTDSIRIYGITDPNTLDDIQSIACTQAYLQRVEASGGFDVLLFHRANLLDLFRNSGFELILSGHLHGGQVRLPGFGGIVSPEGRAFPKYGGGVYSIGNGSTAVVSRGLGNTVCFPRVYNAPELVLITLHCK